MNWKCQVDESDAAGLMLLVSLLCLECIVSLVFDVLTCKHTRNVCCVRRVSRPLNDKDSK